MNEAHLTQEMTESRLRETAASFAYPPTPDIAGADYCNLILHASSFPKTYNLTPKT